MEDSLLWQRLERQLSNAMMGFPGVAGVAVKDLSNGHSIAVHGDEEFPTASTIKIHILTQLLARAQRGELDLDRKVNVTPDMRVPGSGVISYLGEDVQLTVWDIAVLMIMVSDNTATNLCIDWAGMDETNALLREMGLTATTLRRKMQDRPAIIRGDENVATPVECVAMLELLHNGRPSPEVAERCLEILKKPNNGPLNKAIPQDLPVANKPGGMDRVRCDAGIVYLPIRPYAVAVMTKFGLQDPLQQEAFVIDTAKTVHQTMSALDSTNEFGLGVPH